MIPNTLNLRPLSPAEIQELNRIADRLVELEEEIVLARLDKDSAKVTRLTTEVNTILMALGKSPATEEQHGDY